jgi:hypothetical protein
MIPLGHKSSLSGPHLRQDTRDVRASGIAGRRQRQRASSAKPNGRRSRGRDGSIERFDMI